MEEQQLQMFLEWVPTQLTELEGASLEEVSEVLNQMYETEEGQKAVEQLVTMFQEGQTSTTQFKTGGKIDQLAKKMKSGGKSKKCSCGCSVITKKSKGGNIEMCACGCGINKHQDGGKVKRGKNEDGSKWRTKRDGSIVTRNKGKNEDGTRWRSKETVILNEDGTRTINDSLWNSDGSAVHGQKTIGGNSTNIALNPAQSKASVNPIGLPLAVVSKQVETLVSSDDLGDLSFNEAFAGSRAAGSKTFLWNGREYGTELTQPTKPQSSTVEPESQSVVIIQDQALSNHPLYANPNRVADPNMTILNNPMDIQGLASIAMSKVNSQKNQKPNLPYALLSNADKRKYFPKK